MEIWYIWKKRAERIFEARVGWMPNLGKAEEEEEEREEEDYKSATVNFLNQTEM